MNKPISILILLAAVILTGCKSTAPEDETVRFATFNTALYRQEHGVLKKDLENGNNEQIKIIAQIIQEVRPDVLALQEFDFDPRGEYLDLFRENYLEKSWDNSEPINYGYAMAFPSNTGIPTHKDLNNDNNIHSPEDAYGYGRYPGQYAFAILSKYPLDTAAMRTFRKFLWKDMPGAALPVKEDGSPYYSEEVLDIFRLSSKNHVDIPVLINNKRIHALIAHPTPPVFDGKADRNGHRNHDEIRLFADYISGQSGPSYLYDDSGNKASLKTSAPFVIMGDMNADPERGDTYQNPIMQFLDHPRVNESAAWGNRVPFHVSKSGDTLHTTAVFDMRIDYVLPSDEFEVKASRVYWPKEGQDNHRLTKGKQGSDHRLVWVDAKLK